MDFIEIARKFSEDSQDKQALLEASRTLSDRYRAGDYQKALKDPELHAYLLGRLPATHKAIHTVLGDIKELLPNFSPQSMADFGAGPGTASFAAATLWESISNFCQIEKNAAFSQIAKILATNHPRISNASFLNLDLCALNNNIPAELCVIAYALQEISPEHHEKIINNIFANCQNILVLIEPGTPRGFANILKLRSYFLQNNTHILAPCTHQESCPMTKTDWCHFSTRLNRSDSHRRLKGASLSYEDEKYSYLVLSKEPQTLKKARVICNPIKRGGHMIIDLCANGQKVREIITRSDKERFREAKKLRWGSLL